MCRICLSRVLWTKGLLADACKKSRLLLTTESFMKGLSSQACVFLCLLFQKPHLKGGGTPSEYYLHLTESNTFESAPQMSCALFKKGRVLLPSSDPALLSYQIVLFFSGRAGSCLKWKIDHSEQWKLVLHKAELLFRYYNARQWDPWILAWKHLNIKA